MPTLTLRTVGMSYLIEGLKPAELDVSALNDALSAEYGPAVAVMNAAGRPSEADAVIVDRKAVGWDSLKTWIEGWVTDQGCRYSSWVEDGLAPGHSATLHFHR